MRRLASAIGITLRCLLRLALGPRAADAARAGPRADRRAICSGRRARLGQHGQPSAAKRRAARASSSAPTRSSRGAPSNSSTNTTVASGCGAGGSTGSWTASTAVSVFGAIYAGITLDPTPTLTESDAVAAIERIGGARFSRARRPELVVLPIDDGLQARVGRRAHDPPRRRPLLRRCRPTGSCSATTGMLQRQLANASIGHGIGVLGDDKKVSATSLRGRLPRLRSAEAPVHRDLRHARQHRAGRSMCSTASSRSPPRTSRRTPRTTGPTPPSSMPTPTRRTPTTTTSSASDAAASTTPTILSGQHGPYGEAVRHLRPRRGTSWACCISMRSIAVSAPAAIDGLRRGSARRRLPAVHRSVLRLLLRSARRRRARAHARRHELLVEPRIRQRVRGAQRGLLGHHGHQRRVLLSASRNGPAESGLPASGKTSPGPRCPARSMDSGRWPTPRSSTSPITTASAWCCRPTRTTTTAACTPTPAFRTTRSTSPSRGARTARPAFACRVSAPRIASRSRRSSTAASRN